MKDHHAMRVAGAALATKAGITPALPPGDADAAADAALADSMTTMPKGAAWDKFFADHRVDGHTKVLQFAQDAANRTQNADLTAMFQKGAPTVQKHLDKAKAIQAGLGHAAATKAPLKAGDLDYVIPATARQFDTSTATPEIPGMASRGACSLHS